MADANEKINLLKEFREHPEKYLPVIDHAWKTFPRREEGTEWYDDPQVTIGWDAGLLDGNRPYFLECWATCGITMLTYFVSTTGLEDAGENELVNMLEDAKLFRIFDRENPRATAVKIRDHSGNEFHSVNVTVGDEDNLYLSGGTIFPFSRLNEFNGGKTKGTKTT